MELSAAEPDPSDEVIAPREARPAKRGWRSIGQAVAIVAVALAMAAAIWSQRSTIATGLHHVGELRWGWVAAASVIEVVSMVALALLYRELLLASGARLSVTWILAASYTANAICVAVPVIGSGMASRQAYQRFRQGGADAGAASLALSVAGVVSAVTLATVATASALLSGNPGAAASGLVVAMAMVAAIVFLALQLHADAGRARLERLVAVVIRSSQKVTRRPKGLASDLARAVVAAVERMRLGTGRLARLALFGMVNWWADVACLTFATLAAGISGLSLGKILIVWAAGTGAATLSPTPAGIGAVEIAMVAAMAAVGVRDSSAVTAVLVYRIISLKGAASLWAVIYGHVHARPR
jgi:putative heme transporter